MKAVATKSEPSPATWQLWLAAAGLWLLTTLILFCISVGLVVSFITWFVATPILALIEIAGGARK